MELISKCEFAKIVWKKNANNFIVHVAVLEDLESAMSIHSLRDLLLAAL